MSDGVRLTTIDRIQGLHPLFRFPQVIPLFHHHLSQLFSHPGSKSFSSIEFQHLCHLQIYQSIQPFPVLKMQSLKVF